MGAVGGSCRCSSGFHVDEAVVYVWVQRWVPCGCSGCRSGLLVDEIYYGSVKMTVLTHSSVYISMQMNPLPKT